MSLLPITRLVGKGAVRSRLGLKYKQSRVGFLASAGSLAVVIGRCKSLTDVTCLLVL